MKSSFRVFLLLLIIIIPFSGCDKGTEPVVEPLLLTLNPTHVSEYGGADGAIDLTVTGGTTPYSYEWSTGDSTEDIANLTAKINTLTGAESTPWGEPVDGVQVRLRADGVTVCQTGRRPLFALDIRNRSKKKFSL